METASVAERIKEIAEQAAIDHGLELVHAEVAGPENSPIVRVFIDKPGGVTHDNCSEVSTQIGTVLDVEDFIHAAYTLEVSSPGINRPLTKLSHFEQHRGRRVRIRTHHAHEGQKSFIGLLDKVSSSGIELDDEISKRRLALGFDEIKEANYEHQF